MLRPPLVAWVAIICLLGGPSLPAARCQTPPMAAARATKHQVETAFSRVYIKVGTATRLGHVHGVEGQLAAGSLTLGGTGDLVFDLTSLVADRPRARRYVGLDPHFSRSDARKVTANMLGPDVLNVGQYPRAIYTISSIKPTGGQAAGELGPYQLLGRFTLHGITRPVVLTATAQKTDRPGALRLTGSFSIRQTAYGIRPYSTLAGLIRVADELEIWGDLLLVPAAR